MAACRALPKPLEILEAAVIKLLLDQATVVIAPAVAASQSSSGRTVALPAWRPSSTRILRVRFSLSN